LKHAFFFIFYFEQKDNGYLTLEGEVVVPGKKNWRLGKKLPKPGALP
jgi:hypothetical protein